MTAPSLRVGYVTVDTSEADALAAFWASALGYEIVATTPYLLLKDPAGTGPHLHLQRQDPPAEGHTHIDLFAADRLAERRRLEGLGAVVERTVEENGLAWDVLRAPGGGVFCLFQDS